MTVYVSHNKRLYELSECGVMELPPIYRLFIKEFKKIGVVEIKILLDDNS